MWPITLPARRDIRSGPATLTDRTASVLPSRQSISISAPTGPPGRAVGSCMSTACIARDPVYDWADVCIGRSRRERASGAHERTGDVVCRETHGDPTICAAEDRTCPGLDVRRFHSLPTASSARIEGGVGISAQAARRGPFQSRLQTRISARRKWKSVDSIRRDGRLTVSTYSDPPVWDFHASASHPMGSKLCSVELRRAAPRRSGSPMPTARMRDFRRSASGFRDRRSAAP